MIIRLADFDTDALAIVDGARAFSQSTALASWFRSGDEFIADISKIMTLDNVEISIAEHDENIVGGIGIAYVPFTWNQSILVGDEIFWWVFPQAPLKTGRMLFDFAMKRIEEKGARPMFRSLESSPAHIEKFYRRRNLEKLESVYVLRRG